MRSSLTGRLPVLARIVAIVGILLVSALAAPRAEAQDAQVQTRINIQPVAPVTVGSRVTLHVQLTTITGEVVGALTNEQLELWIGDHRERRVRTVDEGRADFNIPPMLGVGSYPVRVVYHGSRTLGASEATAELVIQPATLVVKVVPPLRDIAFSLDDRSFSTGPDGTATVSVDTAGVFQLRLLTTELKTSDTHATFSRWLDDRFDTVREVELPTDEPLQVGFQVSHLISWSFVDLDHKPVDHDRVTSITVKGTHGDTQVFDNDEPRWLLASRVMRLQGGLQEAKVQWGVEDVVIDGANVVNRGQHRFHVEPGDVWQVRLLLYTAHFAARDAFFGFPVGSGFNLEYPDGKVQYFPAADDNNRVIAAALARGQYKISVANAPGLAPAAPIALTRRQDIQLKVISYFDLAVAFLTLGTIALGLLFVGRPHLIAWFPTPWRRKNGRMAPLWTTGLFLLVLVGVPVLTGSYLLTANTAGAPRSVAVPADKASEQEEATGVAAGQAAEQPVADMLTSGPATVLSGGNTSGMTSLWTAGALLLILIGIPTAAGRYVETIRERNSSVREEAPGDPGESRPAEHGARARASVSDGSEAREVQAGSPPPQTISARPVNDSKDKEVDP